MRRLVSWCLALTVASTALVGGAWPAGAATAGRAGGSSAASGVVAAATPTFADVPSNHAFAVAIAWLAAQGISTGWPMTDGTTQFRPAEPVTREAMAAFLYRAAGRPAITTPTTSPFTDVPTTSAFFTPIAWAAARGISTGWPMTDGTTQFRPAEPVTREAMAAFLYRARSFVGPPAASMTAGGQLAAGQRLVSPNGQYSAIMQTDGNFVVHKTGGIVQFATSTAGNPGAYLGLQGDGNLVVYAPGGVAKWSSETAPSSGNSLLMQDDGNLVLRSRGGLVLWASRGGRTPYRQDVLPNGGNVLTGQALVSQNLTYSAVMQGDGNLVVYKAGGIVQFATGTDGYPGAYLRAQGDGNLVVYAPGNVPRWSSATSASSGAALVMQDDGNLVLYAGNGPALWSSKEGRIGSVVDDYPDPWRSGGLDQYVDTWGYYSRECTSFVAWRLHSRNGYEMPRAIGNGGTWRNTFPSQTNSTPAIGAIAEMAGHVAWVAAVNADGTVTVEEYNVPAYSGKYNTRTVPASSFWYIHVKDL